MEEKYRESMFKGREVIVIRYVDPSMSNQLLCKFPDNSPFDFDYSQSAIWSPLVPRFHSLSCLNTKSPDFKRKISFDDDDDGKIGCNVFGKIHVSNIKKKVRAFGLKLNANLHLHYQKKKLLNFDDNKSSKVPEFTPCSPPSSKKGWKKALKMTSKQFKKKRDHQNHHNPSSRITLADYLQCQN